MLKKREWFKISGVAIIERRTKDGKTIDQEIVDNLVVNDGKERVAKLIGGVSTDVYTHIAIGTGTTAAVIGDSALETEYTRAAATIAYEASYKIKFEKTFSFASGVSENITEAGLTDDAVVSGSVLLDRFVFTAKPIDGDTNLYIKITITIT
ncbi:hypothetical protein LCGC14_2103200 [marine sediment metagenome]|uniref:Uncharacterized protein n=1 Tax=marine sediment metagenome TaxID=412755 RepID=A0A0F9E9F0_9ZZZZ